MNEYVPISWRDYVDSRFQESEKQRDFAYGAMEKRLEGMNEFRDTLKNQAATFITRDEQAIITRKLEEDIRMLRESKASLEGKASQASMMVTLLISVAALVMAGITMLATFYK